VRLAQHEFGKLQHGFSRVTAICNWIHDNVEYLRGSTNPLTSAYDTATERAGVCRDFAHLAIAFCRAVLIPARFVAGYAYSLQPPDFHAYFEAYLNRAWYIFDSTRLAPQTGLIRVGSGHDAADTSFATIFGPAKFFINEDHDGIGTRPGTHLYNRRYLDFVVVREALYQSPIVALFSRKEKIRYAGSIP
jgi:transglutaminase-like putative cysteine protease